MTSSVSSSGSTQSVAALEKQLQAINKQIQQETNSKDSAQAKTQEIAALQAEEQAIEMEIQQAEKVQQQQQQQTASAVTNASGGSAASIAGTKRATAPGDDAVGQQLNVQA